MSGSTFIYGIWLLNKAPSPKGCVFSLSLLRTMPLGPMAHSAISDDDYKRVCATLTFTAGRGFQLRVGARGERVGEPFRITKRLPEKPPDQNPAGFPPRELWRAT
jgi:hypothetical protein